MKWSMKLNMARPELINEKNLRVLFRSMNKMEELASIKAPVDTSLLRQSIRIIPDVPGFDRYILTDGVHYGIHVEFGTQPHFMPSSVGGSGKHPLSDWARRKLGDEGAAWAVANKIARVGTPAQPFMRPAFASVKAFWVKKFWEDEYGSTKSLVGL